jgi:hypothetical protein
MAHKKRKNPQQYVWQEGALKRQVFLGTRDFPSVLRSCACLSDFGVDRGRLREVCFAAVTYPKFVAALLILALVAGKIRNSP